jgi:hypothetical protein
VLLNLIYSVLSSCLKCVPNTLDADTGKLEAFEDHEKGVKALTPMATYPLI